MTLPAPGNPISLGQVGNEFGYGYDFASYYGVYYGIGGSAGRFVLAGNPFYMSYFYSTFKITGGSAGYGSSTTITVPVYNTITITCVGGSGGNGGNAGFNLDGCTGSPAGDSGGPGGTSSFGGYVAAGGGAGGGGSSPGSPGSSSTQTFTNPVQGGSGPPSGSSLYVEVGGGGGGGTGGCQYYKLYGFCNCWNRAGNGSSGAGGSVTISWT